MLDADPQRGGERRLQVLLRAQRLINSDLFRHAHLHAYCISDALERCAGFLICCLISASLAVGTACRSSNSTVLYEILIGVFVLLLASSVNEPPVVPRGCPLAPGRARLLSRRHSPAHTC